MQIPNAVRIPHSELFTDLVNRLLQKDPSDRIGTNGGADEILAHQWFLDQTPELFVDIEKVKARTEPPVVV